MNNTYAVLGGGSWGTAIVKMLCENNNIVNWYIRSEEDVLFIKKKSRNSKYLQSVVFDKSKINPSSSIREIVAKSDIIILAIPSPFLDTELKKISDLLKDKILFSALKGVIPESHLIVSEHLNEFYKIPFSKIGIITGPCHAEEVALAGPVPPNCGKREDAAKCQVCIFSSCPWSSCMPDGHQVRNFTQT